MLKGKSHEVILIIFYVHLVIFSSYKFFIVELPNYILTAQLNVFRLYLGDCCDPYLVVF